MLSAALVLLCVMKSQLRLLLIPVFALGAWMLPAASLPHILISEDGKTLVVRTNDGGLIVSGSRAGRFEQKVWRAALGLSASEAKKVTRKPFCDNYGCILHIKGKVIAHVKHPSGFYEDYRREDIVVSRLSAPDFCHEKANVIDRYSLKSRGAHSVVIKGTKSRRDDDIIINSSIPLIKSPWHRHYQKKNQ